MIPRMIRTGCIVLSTMFPAGSAFAAMQTAEIALAMTCPMSDPPLIERVILRVPGVQSIDISYDDQTATIVFDDAQADKADFTDALAEFNMVPDEM